MTSSRLARVALPLAFAYLASAAAQTGDAALDARLKHLETQLRCLVCQNQTLAESNAPLAEDLRREVRELASSGRSDDEIRAFLVARYGDFVLYQPPVRPATWLLWFGPFLLLAGGGAAWFLIVRRRRAAASAEAPLSQDAADRARALLDDAPRT